MKFGQLLKYNMKNIFLKKSYTCGAEAFIKIKIEHISRSTG